MPVLSISAYKKANAKRDVGQVARWKLTGKKADGAIIQYVEHRTAIDNEPMRVHKFYEAWKVEQNVVLPGPEDFFLAPRSYYTSSGTICIASRAHFKEGDFCAMMKDMDMCDPESPISGILWSNPGQIPAKYDTRPRQSAVCRLWQAQWVAAKSKAAFKLEITSKTRQGRQCEISRACTITK